MKQVKAKHTCKCQHSKLVDKLQELRESAFLYDIKVTCGHNVSFKAHRCILAANSLYFKGIFTTAEATQLESVDISRETTHSDYIDNVLEYMYSGHVNLHLDNVIEIAVLASALQCSDLFDVCLEYIDRILDSSNCMYLYLKFYNLGEDEARKQDSLTRIQAKLWCSVEDNFCSKVILSEDILKVPLDDLLHLLYGVSVSCQHILNLFQFAIKWLNSHTDDAALQVADVISSLILKCSQNDQMRTKDSVEDSVKYATTLLHIIQIREPTPVVSERIITNLKTALTNFHNNVKTETKHQDKDDYIETNALQVPKDVNVDSKKKLCEKENHYDSDTDEAEEVKKDEGKEGMEIEDKKGVEIEDKEGLGSEEAFNSSSSTTERTQFTIKYNKVCKKNSMTKEIDTDLGDKEDTGEVVCEDHDGVGKQGSNSEKGMKLNFGLQKTGKKELNQARQHKLIGKQAAVGPKADVKFEMTVDGKKIFKCDQCYKTFTRNSGLQKHILIHTGKRPFTCSECGIGCKTKYQLKWHRSKVHVGVTEFRCDKCGLRFCKNSNFEKHTGQCEGKKLSCDVCGKMFQYQVELDRHTVSHSDNRTHTCDQCPRRFKHAQNLKAHVLLKHQNIDKVTSPSVCDHCGKVLKNRNCLRRHLLLHAEERPYKCRLCTKSYTQSTGLEVHMRLHTGDKPYQCEICSEMFVIKCNLDRHIQRHLGDKPHKCDKCDKAFVQITDLKRHQTVHSGEKKFPCQFCGKLFALKKSVPVHERIHTGERPFKCMTCKKGFLTRSDLKRHEKTHLKEKPTSRLCKGIQENLTDNIRNKQNEVPMVNFMENYPSMDRIGFQSLPMNRNEITPQSAGQFVSPFSSGIGFY